MKRLLFGLLILGVAALGARAEEADIYPKAVLDEVAMQKYTVQMKNASREMKRMMGEQKVYTTSDDFEDVYDYYKDAYPETDKKLKKKNPKLPDGRMLREAYFCLDEAKSINQSKHWMKLQWPSIGKVNITKRHKVVYEDVRELTVITIVEKK
jgi:hypothetical protein